MEDQDVFQKIGKRMPYEVPGDFFDKISGETLLKAKNQPTKKGNLRRLFWGITAAASLAGAMFIVFSVAEKDGSTAVVAQKTEQPTPGLPASDSLPQQTAEVKIPVMPSVEAKKETATKPETKKQLAEAKEDESLNEVLAGLSDDELLQMVAEFQSDPFMGETITE